MPAYERYFDGSYAPPDNLVEFQYIREQQRMFVGGECDNEFEIRSPIDEGDSVDVIYVQQDKTSLTKPAEAIEREYQCGFKLTFAKVTLYEDETSLFDDRLLECLAQVRITKSDGSLVYEPCERVLVMRTLD